MATEYSARFLGNILGFNYKLIPCWCCLLGKFQECCLNEEMRRKAHGTSSHSEVLVFENRGRIQKKELKGSRQNSISKSKSRYK